MFCMANILRELHRAKRQTCDENAETTTILRLASCIIGNALPEEKNHGRYAQEVRMRRRGSLTMSRAILGLQVLKVT